MNKKGFGGIGQALLIVLCMNLVLWFGQIAVLEINPDSSNFFDVEGTLLDKYRGDNNTISGDLVDQLPSSESSVSVETGNIFTDLFTTIKNWFLDSTGLSYLFNVLSAPISFLKAIQVPPLFAYALGSLWYILTFFLFVAFMRGDSG